MFVSELKGLDQTQGLFNWAPNWEVIDGDLPQDALVVNDEQTPETEWMSSSQMSKGIQDYLLFRQALQKSSLWFFPNLGLSENSNIMVSHSFPEMRLGWCF